MPERVVHAFEVVEVDHHDGESVLGASGPLDADLQPIAEQSAGGKAGKWVVMRDVVDVLVGTLALSQVVGDSDKAGDAFFAVAQCGDDKLHGNARSVFPDIGPLPLVDEAHLRGETKDVMVGMNLGIELRREIKGALVQFFRVVQFEAVAADKIALLVPEHSFRRRIDGGDDSGLVGDDDAEGGACDDGFIEVERALEVFFVLITRGDVGDRRRDAVRQLDYLNLITSRAVLPPGRSSC